MAVCKDCQQEMLENVGCSITEYTAPDGKVYKRLVSTFPHGDCNDCGCPQGELHHIHCDMEECPVCKGQMIGFHKPDCPFDNTYLVPDDEDELGLTPECYGDHIH